MLVIHGSFALHWHLPWFRKPPDVDFYLSQEDADQINAVDRIHKSYNPNNPNRVGFYLRGSLPLDCLVANPNLLGVLSRLPDNMVVREHGLQPLSSFEVMIASVRTCITLKSAYVHVTGVKSRKHLYDIGVVSEFAGPHLPEHQELFDYLVSDQ